MMERERLLAHPRMIHYVAHSSYDPVPALERLRVPMLAVFGGADTVVPVEASVKAMRAAFERAGNAEFTYRIFPEADHGIRVKAADGSRVPAPGLTEFVVDWVESVTRP